MAVIIRHIPHRALETVIAKVSGFDTSPDHYKITKEEQEKRAARRETTGERWSKRVNKNGPVVKEELGPCWVWTARVESNGYGYLRVARRNRGAHCISYEMFKGEIPEGLQVDHLCKNRRCVNPDHLETVTNRVNVLRGDGVTARNATKTHCVRGHEFTPENTKLKFNHKTKRYGRCCITCIKETAKIYWVTVDKPRKAERKERNGGIGTSGSRSDLAGGGCPAPTAINGTLQASIL